MKRTVLLLLIATVLVSQALARQKKTDRPSRKSAPIAADPAISELKAPRDSAGKVKGIFALTIGSQPLSDFELRHPDLTGVSLRANWSEIEPGEGKFQWLFDPEIVRARAAGKEVMLRIHPGVTSPQWLYQGGAKAFEFQDVNPHHKTAGQVLKIPLPWDPVFLSKWTALIRASGQKYADDPTVVLIQMVGPNKSGGEMHLPDSRFDQAAWIEAGYTREKLVDAYKVVINAYDEAYPHKPLALNVAFPVFKDGAAEQIVDYAVQRLGRRLYLQHNALAAKTMENSPMHHLVLAYRDRVGGIGFQLLCPVTPRGQFNDEGRRFGGTLRQAFALGLKAGASYFEIYPIDLKNPAAARDIHELAVVLRGK